MFVLKSLSRLFLGDEEKRDLVNLSGGSLWQVDRRGRADKLVINRTQLMPLAQLILRRAEQPFEFILVTEETIEGTKRDITTKDKSQQRKQKSHSTPLGNKLNLYRRYESIDNQEEASPGVAIVFGWCDPLGKEFEYVAPNCDEHMAEMFHLMVVQCWWESLHRRPGTEAPDSELRELLIVEMPPEEEREEQTDKPDDSSRRNDAENIVFESSPALFYVFDAATNTFVPRVEGFTVATISSAMADDAIKGPSRFFLSVCGADNPSVIHHRQPIDPDATLHTDRKNGAFIWCHFTPEGVTWTYSLRFEDAPSVMALSNAIGQAIYEILNSERLASKIKEEADQRYLMEGWVESEIHDGQEGEDFNDSTTDESEEEYDSEEDDDDDEGPTTTSHSEEKNQQLSIGYKSNRSFVLRGNSIGIFGHSSDDQDIQLISNIRGVKTVKGNQTLSPTKMMLHQQDRSLLLLDPNQGTNLIHRMDVETGKVVEEWKVRDDSLNMSSKPSLTAILPSAKYSQLTDEATLVGLNSSSIFRIDPRLPGTKAVEGETRSYATDNRFSCGVATGAGELAVASEKGEIRLFDKLDRRAKTLLPGFGDSITAIDVTESGRYIVATCRTYLLFICTEIPGSGGTLGFRRTMGNAAKPIPKRLQLRPEHVAYLGGVSVNFTPARFSTGQSEERSIITSTGPYVITWNVRRVKQGKLYDYQIRKYPEAVVADNFLYGQDRSIVVTLPHHVTLMSKKSLASPSPAIFKGERLTATRRDGNNADLPISIGNIQLQD